MIYKWTKVLCFSFIFTILSLTQSEIVSASLTQKCLDLEAAIQLVGLGGSLAASSQEELGMVVKTFTTDIQNQIVALVEKINQLPEENRKRIEKKSKQFANKLAQIEKTFAQKITMIKENWNNHNGNLEEQKVLRLALSKEYLTALAALIKSVRIQRIQFALDVCLELLNHPDLEEVLKIDEASLQEFDL